MMRQQAFVPMEMSKLSYRLNFGGKSPYGHLVKESCKFGSELVSKGRNGMYFQPGYGLVHFLKQLSCSIRHSVCGYEDEKFDML